MFIDSADDDEWASNIVVKYFNDKLIICDNQLYVCNNNIALTIKYEYMVYVFIFLITINGINS